MNFRQLVFEALKRNKSRPIVDSAHGYAIMLMRLQDLFNLVYAEENTCKIDAQGLLDCLTEIAALSQHYAESIGIIEPETAYVDNAQDIQDRLTKTQQALISIVLDIDFHKKSAPALQLGKNQYAVEFSEDWLKSARKIAQLEDN